SFISGRLATKSNQIKQLIRNSRSASLQRTFKKSFTSFSHSTRNKTRDGLIRVRNIRALNGRFNTSITHAYSIVIGSKHITLNATGGGFLTAKIAEGQWYRYAPSYVSPAYHLLEGFPFIQEPPSGDLQERVLIRHHDYDQC